MTSPFESIRTTMAGLASRTSTTLERRRTLRRVARFSAHRLSDIGLERDWDGSVLRNGRAI